MGNERVDFCPIAVESSARLALSGPDVDFQCLGGTGSYHPDSNPAADVLQGALLLQSMTGLDTPLHSGVSRNFFPGATLSFRAGPLAQYDSLTWSFQTTANNTIGITGRIDLNNDGQVDSNDIAPLSNIFSGLIEPFVDVSLACGCGDLSLDLHFSGQTNQTLAAFYGIGSGGWEGDLAVIVIPDDDPVPPMGFTFPKDAIGEVRSVYVPEPSSAWLLLTCFAGFAYVMRARQARRVVAWGPGLVVETAGPKRRADGTLPSAIGLLINCGGRP